MKKLDIGNGMAASGGTTMVVSAVSACLIGIGVAVSENYPYTSSLGTDEAEKIANAVAIKLGYETQLVSSPDLMHKNAKYFLTPYDSLYYNCTGQLPTNNTFKWQFDSGSQYYA